MSTLGAMTANLSHDTGDALVEMKDVDKFYGDFQALRDSTLR